MGGKSSKPSGKKMGAKSGKPSGSGKSGGSDKPQKTKAKLPGNTRMNGRLGREMDEELLKSQALEKENQVKMHQSGRAKKETNKAKGRGGIQGKLIELDEDWVLPNFPKSRDTREFIDEALGTNFVFETLEKEERANLISAMEEEVVSEGAVIITQGDVGDYFYVVESGSVNFIADGKNVGSCKEGGSFGELALLYDSPRAATCIAQEDSKLWKVDQRTFRQMIAENSNKAEQGVTSILNKIPFLANLDESIKSTLSDALSIVKYIEGERIFSKGDEGKVLYIVKDGSIRLHDIGHGQSTFEDQILKSSDFFGERALLTKEPRAATATAASSCTLLAISRETFELTCGSLEEIISSESKKKFLQSVPIFAQSKFEAHEMKLLSESAQEISFKKGDFLMKRGEETEINLYIITKGRLLVTAPRGLLIKLKEGDYFGDKNITSESSTSDSDVSVEDDTTCWVLGKKVIEDIIGDLNRLGKPLAYVSSKVENKIRLSDINKKCILGMGAFGKVWLTTYRKTSKPYALKMMAKEQLVKTKQTTSVLREKNVMASIEHPFIMEMISCFQDENYVYFLLEVIPGGELFNLVHTDKKDGLSLDHAQFYGACVIEALAHLHKRSIIYRDLKPENVLIDKDGYCVVADMGFAKIVVDKTYTLCGTPEYLAPEIILSKGHDSGVDCWSFAVLLYEMIAGQSAFYVAGTDQASLFKRIVMVKYRLTHEFNADAKDLIGSILVRRSANRLGKLRGGTDDIKDHPFFDTIDFKKLCKKEIPAPWKPAIKDALDTSNFDDFSSEEKISTKHAMLTKAEQALFKDF